MVDKKKERRKVPGYRMPERRGATPAPEPVENDDIVEPDLDPKPSADRTK